MPHLSMTFEDAQRQADALNARAAETSQVLRTFPRGPMGLTPDAVKALPAYVAAKRASDMAMAELRAFNGVYVKQFAQELAAARRERRASK